MADKNRFGLSLMICNICVSGKVCKPFFLIFLSPLATDMSMYSQAVLWREDTVQEKEERKKKEKP